MTDAFAVPMWDPTTQHLSEDSVYRRLTARGCSGQTPCGHQAWLLGTRAEARAACDALRREKEDIELMLELCSGSGSGGSGDALRKRLAVVGRDLARVAEAVANAEEAVRLWEVPARARARASASARHASTQTCAV